MAPGLLQQSAQHLLDLGWPAEEELHLAEPLHTAWDLVSLIQELTAFNAVQGNFRASLNLAQQFQASLHLSCMSALGVRSAQTLKEPKRVQKKQKS